MAGNPLIFKDADKAKETILASQKKEIIKFYDEWAAEIGERAKYYSHKSAPSYAVAERQMKELMKQMEATSHEVANEIYTGVKKNIYLVADSVVQQNAKWLKSLGFEGGTIDAAFNYVPDEIVRNLITGQIYDSGWSLSKRIWSDNEETMKQAYQIVAGGIAQNKSIYEIAKDLEKYVQPGAKKPWNLVDKDGRKIYPKQVDYNAQRLGRTLVQHGYQQSFVATTQKNPFITDYIWRSNGSRACELCISRDGQLFSKYDLPMDHPNGMCTMEPNVSENLVDDLADWFNSPEGTYPEIDEFASNFGYAVKDQVTVANFIDKYGTSTKSPNAWFNSLTQIQKAEAKLLKEESGLTWNKWYEKNIYVGDGSNLGGKKKIQAFSDAQEKYLKPYGFAKDKMPYDFDDWSHKVSYEQASEILKNMGTSWADPHPYQELMKFYNQHLTDKNFVMKAATTTKKVASATKTVGTQFDSAAWHKAIRNNNLGVMESWCDDWLLKISSLEQSGVEVYTGSAYVNMNEYLRGLRSSTSYTEEIKQATAALKKASLPEEVIVRRGSDYNMLREFGIDISEANKDKLIGAVVTDKGFMSASPASGGGFDREIEYVIKVPKGSQAMYVDTISRNRGEEELLINRGSKHIIEDIEFGRHGKVKKIYMTLKNLKGPK